MDAPRAEPARPSGIAGVIGELQAERLRLILMRTSFAALALLHLVLVLWLVPWVPFGMTTGDYTSGVAFTLLLALASAVMTVVFLVVWAPYLRNESLPEFLRIIFGAKQLIRGRHQFHSRLQAECRRARRDRRRIFSLIVVQLPVIPADPPASTDGYEGDGELAAFLVRSIVRSEDVVSLAWPHEVWVLALGANTSGCGSILERLTAALSYADIGKDWPEACRIGHATFEADGHAPPDLFTAAYQRLEDVPSRRPTQLAA